MRRPGASRTSCGASKGCRVCSAAFASNFVPLGGGGGGGDVIVEGKSVEPGKEPSIAFVAATPHLRKTLGVALVRGRDITETRGDHAHAGRAHQPGDGEARVA